MKRRLCPALVLLVVGYAITASCQLEPVITDFQPMTTLTWSNRQANTYCDIEWLCNLNHEWIPGGSNLQATQAVSSVDISGFQLLLPQIQWLLRNAPDGTPAGLFFRVVSSEQPIQPRSFTNALRLVNVSTSVLTSVTLGLRQGGTSIPITNFPSIVQMATTDVVRVWSPFPPPSTTIIVPIGEVQDGWYVSYGHDGSNRSRQFQVMPFGSVEKNILLTVSNNSLTIDLQWIRLMGTFLY